MVPLSDVKAHLRVTHGDSDLEISAMIDAATAMMEKITNRALVQRTFTWRLQRFPINTTSIVLPITPVTSITQIDYVDDNGATQPMNSADYTAVLDDDYGYVALAYDKTWPDTRLQELAVTVTLVAGLATPPAAAVHALKLLVGHWYENREAVGTIGKPIELSCNALIDTLKASFTVTV